MGAADRAERNTELTPEQLMNAGAIIETGREMGLDDQTINAALATALMESRLRNLDYGDRDSVGLFQQRPSQGWGTVEQIRDPKYAARKFFEAYMGASGGTVLERIANTQRPAAQYRDDYANFFDLAGKAFESVTKQAPPVLHSVAPNPVVGEPQPMTTAGSGGTVVVTTAASPTETRPDITADTPPEQVEEYINTYYPDVAPFLQDPAIRMLLYAAAIEDWDERKLDAALEQTEYWQTHGPSSRQLDALLAEDPRAATQVIDSAKGIISDLFAKQGLDLDDAGIGEVAKQALRQGIIGFNQSGQVFVASEDRLDGLAAFGLGTQVEAGLPTGEASFNADSLMTLARTEYMLPITRRQAEEWAVQMLNGEASEESIRAELNGRARERYGWLGLSEGQTVRSRTDGLVAEIANTLELDPDTIDLLAPKYKGVLEFFDAKAESYRSMTLGEAAQWARDQPEWQRTRQGRAQSAGVTRGLVDFFEGRAA